MGRNSSAPRILCAAPLALPDETPRAKRLRVTSLSVATPDEAARTALSDSTYAAALRILRTETELTQEDAAALGAVSSRSVGRYERAEVDLSQVRYVLRLIEFRERQKAGR